VTRRSKTGLALAALALLALGGVWTWLMLGPRRTPESQPPLATLDASTLQAFKDAFNADAEAVPVLALFSPT